MAIVTACWEHILKRAANDAAARNSSGYRYGKLRATVSRPPKLPFCRKLVHKGQFVARSHRGGLASQHGLVRLARQLVSGPDLASRILSRNPSHLVVSELPV